MKLIRYAIRKEDLHQLLHTIGVLREEERLLAVNNLDLAEQQQDVVVITVSTEAAHVLPGDLGAWTDREIQRRYAELSILEDGARRQLRKAEEEMQALRSERDKRESDMDLSDDGIPGTVEMNIWEQVRRLLGGEDERR
ncbi:MAG: hypothetical protein RRA94_08380 [Bacteroidota bacterium]|nr:hypothetical protein [Bacteroidota bacterium]